MDRIIIFDTTLRDGEQSPGFSMNTMEKLEMARQLARLGVDVIEAGFPISSEDDFEATRQVAKQVGTLDGAPSICGLSRVGLGDIDRCWEAVKYARKPRIHTVVATSDIHLKYKLRKSRAEILKASVEAVRHARGYCEDVEFSPEDASRSDFDYLCDVLSAVIEAGARTINIPDTVGYAIPQEWAERIAKIRERVQGIEKAVLSVHCHNDLGQAVANSLAAIRQGARQVECTINGIGERAGNASLEEIVMALRTRKDFFNAEVGVRTEEIFKTSRLLSHITGIHVQPNKAIVGENAFAHEAGIHQDGVLKEKLTYEIMRPEDIGRPSNKLVLGKHSGRHALTARLKDLGFALEAKDLDRAFTAFKSLADRKKEVFDEDLVAIVTDEATQTEVAYALDYLHVLSGTSVVPSATVRLRSKDGQLFQDSGVGDGPVDAVLAAIDAITGLKGTLQDYAIRAATSGKDAVGEVAVKVSFDGTVVSGKGSSTDVIEASARAYLSALNRLVQQKNVHPRKEVGP
ncbi:MAG: 2-isopropylmalate synthase [Candidatus Rokubacteria bacterium]|nr:2-isopropylmalate synthase [Candidatus Rokubacteria bacterium]MBI3824997.1 2-isopropylmalate synthase [Candidatus Rokubacteria bacterium]